MCFEHFRHGRSLEEEEEDPLMDENEKILLIPAICKLKIVYDLVGESDIFCTLSWVFDVNGSLLYICGAGEG